MGLGKTVITLTAINDLKYNRFVVNKVLVIAPKKVAETTWTNEVKKWDHLKLLRISTVLGTEKQRISALMRTADIYVINRENVQWLVDFYKTKWCFDMVVVDELTSFKNPQAKRFRKLASVRERIDRVIGLTGTPAPNGVADLWSQMYLIDKGARLGTRIGGFRERYLEPEEFGWVAKPGAEEAIRNKINDICVSMKAEDYLELPECVFNYIPVVLNEHAVDVYNELESRMFLEIDERSIEAVSAAALSNKLLQLCNGSMYDENRNIVNVHNCKVEALMELIEALNGQSVLVFYNFQHDRDKIIEALSKTKLHYRELKTPEDERAWNNKEVDVLLAHPASSAYGLNLQDGGHHAVWFGMNWSLELYQQANKRLHRQGQQNRVFIHHLVVPNALDERVANALKRKEATQESLLEALKAEIRKVQKEVRGV
jgi:SNF2 family DNA or RNA helicase